MTNDKKKEYSESDYEKVFDAAVEAAKKLADQVEHRALNVDKMPKREDVK